MRQKRITLMLAILEKHKIKKVILGAIGCGVFGLDVEHVAQTFQKVINKNLYQGEIIFAIPDSEKMKIFLSVFN